MTELRATDLTLTAKDAVLVDRVSFELRQGEFVALLGPNGAGKTSLIRASLGLQMPSSGTAILGETDTAALPPNQRARRLAYLPQVRPLAWPNRVKDVVALGRFAYGAASGQLSDTDSKAINRALKACDLEHLADRGADTLSGGELARMHCARAFAAEAPLLIADEPTAALDPRHQFRILDLIAAYVGQGGGALVVLHDLRLAARYASRLIWMKGGRVLADGPPEDTLTAARLEEVYGVRAQVDGRRVEMDGPL